MQPASSHFFPQKIYPKHTTSMIIDGEKYACEACIRGHRVANCQHNDRRLQHIKQKGRPVSQCRHCRTMRKSRSAHIKCHCGKTTNLDTHQKASVDDDRCFCSSGARCICAFKKDTPHLDTAPKSNSDSSSSSAMVSSTGDFGCVPAFEDCEDRNSPHGNTNTSQTSEDHGINGAGPVYIANNIDKCSVGELPDNTDGDSQNESSAVHGLYLEQYPVQPEMDLSLVGCAIEPLIVQQLNMHPPQPDLPITKYSAYVEIDSFGGLSNVEQTMSSGDLGPTFVYGRNYEFDVVASYDREQTINGFDPYQHGQPTWVIDAMSGLANMPAINGSGVETDDSYHVKDPLATSTPYVGLNAAVAFPGAEHLCSQGNVAP